MHERPLLHDPASANRYVIRGLWGSFPVTLQDWHKRMQSGGAVPVEGPYGAIQTVWAWEDEPAQMARVETMTREEAHMVLLDIQGTEACVHGLCVVPAAFVRTPDCDAAEARLVASYDAQAAE